MAEDKETGVAEDMAAATYLEEYRHREGEKPPTGEEPTIRHRRDAKLDELEQSARSRVDEQPMRWSTRKTTATMAEKQPGGIPTAAQRSAIWERPKSTGSIPTATQQTPPTAH